MCTTKDRGAGGSWVFCLGLFWKTAEGSGKRLIGKRPAIRQKQWIRKICSMHGQPTPLLPTKRHAILSISHRWVKMTTTHKSMGWVRGMGWGGAPEPAVAKLSHLVAHWLYLVGGSLLRNGSGLALITALVALLVADVVIPGDDTSNERITNTAVIWNVKNKWVLKPWNFFQR